MQNRYNVEIVNRIFKDIRKDLKSFDDIVTCFCGDFRPILSIIKGIEFDRIARAIIRTFYL